MRSFAARLLLLCLATLTGFSAASAKTFKYAFQGDLNSLDPHSLNESFSLGALGNAFEGLIRRDKDLNILPGLAERWELMEPTRWRFHLRKGVKFHRGENFTVDDAIFSLERARGTGVAMRNKIDPTAKLLRVDDFTLDIVTAEPNPILHAEFDTLHILSKSWALANGATQAQPALASSLSAFALKANGTGPFEIVSHEPGVKTVFKPYAGWWGKPEHNLTEVVFTTIKSDATRVAALLSGEVDLIDPVPLQDIDRIRAAPNTTVMITPEIRTIFLNLDQMRPELLYSNIKGKNPLKDVRVRKAMYQAIDIEAIKTKIMRGLATPTPILIAPSLFARSGEFKRFPYDIAAAKKLLAEAGYPTGFEIEMDCPNDRYVNDEAICQAVVQMLSRIDIRVKLNSLPKAKYFAKAGVSGKYDTSFNLLGWTPASLDPYNILFNITQCRDADGRGGITNSGGYCNPKVDDLMRRVSVETDAQKRTDLIVEAFRIHQEDVGHIPLHQQAIVWGMARGVSIAQRADNHILMHWARKD